VPTAAQAVAEARRRLEESAVPSPALDARLLVRHALGWSAAELTLRADERLPPERLRPVTELVRRRGERVPLQVLLGRWGFRRVELTMRAGVFVPRPETEVLVEEALRRAPADAVVVEPCTGSGAIAAALADERADLRVHATEIDPVAATLARENTAAHGERVTVAIGDLLEPIDAALRGHVDVLVSNPPYLADGELDGLEPEVAQADPHRALVSGASGHEVTDRLIDAATDWLAPGGWLLMEADPRRADEVARRCRSAGLVDVAAWRDLAGRPRFVRGARRHVRSDPGRQIDNVC
jgi:release factor glutamine methyltransferase